MKRGLSNQTARPEHDAALPLAEVLDYIATLKSSNERQIVKLAFEFLILTVARTSEVLNAERSEVVSAEALWVVPASLMKAKREHRVPIAPRVLDILQQAKVLSDDGFFFFPRRSAGKPLSNMALLMALRRLAVPVIAHGFRSSFRDWAAEMTNIPREMADMALAHTVENKVEAAYRRGDLLAKRRELMELWGSYVG